MRTKRYFISIKLPKKVINEIKNIQNLIKKKNIFNGKFTEPENLHLTLKFLGEIDDYKINKAKVKLGEIRFKIFDCSLGNVGVFSKKFIRIIWIELLGKVFELQKEVDNKLEWLFEPEKRFMSHITIARVKHVFNKKEAISYLNEIKPIKIKFKIDKFYLMESELSPEGAIYKDIKKYNLES